MSATEPENNNSPNQNIQQSNNNDSDASKDDSILGKSITAIPQGLEALCSEKNFFFQEIQRGLVEYDLKDERRPTFNIILNSGKRIYVMVNQAPRFASKRYFHYALVGPNGMTCMTFEGCIGSAPVFPCSNCETKKHIISATVFDYKMGEIVTEHPKAQCYEYLNRPSPGMNHKVKVVGREDVFRAFTRRPTLLGHRNFNSGLEVISDDPVEKSLIAKISNCRNLDFEFAKGPVNFALSLAESYVSLDPVAKALLLACAVIHEIYYMRNPRRRKDTIGFQDV